VIEIITIFILAIAPALLGLEILRRSKRRFQARIRQIRAESVPNRAVTGDFFEVPEERSFFIGETSCRYNARSPHLRCAIDPSGPCEGCLHYESR
jgi:hypothetical protein